MAPPEPRTKPEEPRTPEVAPRTAEPVDLSDECRVLFPEEPYALPETASQKANAKWVKAHGAPIKLTGTGRTVEVVRREMAIFSLGATTMRKRVRGDAASLFVQPECTQAAHNKWVGANLEHLDEDVRKKVLPLTGEGRTAEVVGADIALVIAGAKHSLGKAVGSLPADASQATNASWVKDNGASGLIKLTGSGRTVEVVRGDMACYLLGADAASRLVRNEETAITEQPSETQSAHNAWAKAWLDEDERKQVLPLTGEGRTAAVVGADIALVVAGAKHALAKLW